MRKLTLLLIAGSFLVVSCNFIGAKKVRGNGVLQAQQRNITDFKGVSVRGDMDVVLVPGSAFSVRVEADENLLPYIETERDGNMLVIAPRKGYNLRPETEMKIYVTAPIINDVEVVGSGNVVSQGIITANNKLTTDVSGSGDVKLEVDAPEVGAEITGSGNINLGGNTRKFTAEITGSGDLMSFNLLSETTDVEISGSGNAKVFASKQLGIEINGSGNVDYKGNPASINQNVAGSGNVNKVQ
jgi:hypothetical protein